MVQNNSCASDLGDNHDGKSDKRVIHGYTSSEIPLASSVPQSGYNTVFSPSKTGIDGSVPLQQILVCVWKLLKNLFPLLSWIKLRILSLQLMLLLLRTLQLKFVLPLTCLRVTKIQ